jgi:hypothetical protein
MAESTDVLTWEDAQAGAEPLSWDDAQAAAKKIANREGAQVLSPLQEIGEGVGALQRGAEKAGALIANLPTELINLGGTLAGGKKRLIEQPFEEGKTMVPKTAVDVMEAAARSNLAPLGVFGPKGEQVAEGLAKTARKTTEGLTTPGMALTLPFAAAKPVQALFGAGIVASLPDQVNEAVKVFADPNSTTAQKTEAAASVGVNALFLGLIAHGMSREQAASTLKETGLEVPKEQPPVIPPPPIPPEVLDAGRVLPKAAGEAVKDLTTPEPVKPEVTPDAEIEAGINKAIAPQPKEANATQKGQQQESVPGERAGDDAQRPPAEAGGGGGVQPAEAVTPEKGPPGSDVLLTPLEERLSKPFTGKNWTKEALEYGAGLDPAKPEQLAELKQLEAKYAEQLKTIPKTVENFNQISEAGTKKQWVTEAIQAAEGLDERDAAREVLGKDYKPPFPKSKLTPAIQVAGKLFIGEDHVAAYRKAKDSGQPDTSGAQEGFVRANGKFISRADAAKLTGLPTAKEPGKLHSSDLPSSAGAPAEAAAKVEQEFKTTIGRNLQRDPKEAKSELVSRLQTALEKAPEKQPEENPEKIKLHIPGDGNFEIINSKEAIGTVLDRAKQISTRAEGGSSISRRHPIAPPKAIRTVDDFNKAIDFHDLYLGSTIADKSNALADLAKRVNAEKPEAVTVRDVNDFIEKKRQAAVAEPQPIGAGPGAATRPGATIATDIGAKESNLPPLEKLAQVVRAFPEQKGSFKDKLNQWLTDIGVPLKDAATRTLTALRAVPAWIEAKRSTLPEVKDLDRRVGQWNREDWTGGQAAREFGMAIKRTFQDRAKLRALSNWIDAAGVKDLLTQRAAATKDPALRKTYEDAAKFGPEEQKLAAGIRQYHDEMLAWAQREGALEEGLDNYLHRYYREGDPGLERKLRALEYLKFTKDFNGFKKRYYDSDFDAEQAGKTPEKDAAKRILAYDHGFRQALVARAFVKSSFDAEKAVAKDGRPELDVVGGGFKVGEGDGKGVTLIKPKWRQDTGDPKDYRGDYVRFNHPAFQKWKFAATDSGGKPILVQGDILVHPDFAGKYEALFNRSWWGKGPIRRLARGTSSFVKQTMLQGPFHLFQITTGGIEHRINPFRLMDINTSDPAQQRMAEAGLFAEEGPYQTEGVAGGGLLDKIPVAGEYFQAAKDYLFNDYIPRWKMTLALEAEKRNLQRYSADIAAGKVTPEQITRMSARQAAAVFGGQNQRAIYRSKTFQDNLRMAFLAPDFGEERIRQLLQATGKYGHEQRMALVIGAAGLMVVAKVIEKALTGETHLTRPFTVTYNGKEYGLRNPASDAWHLFSDPIGYFRNRLNPTYTRPLLEALTGRDSFGRKRSAGQQLSDEVKQIVPIPLRGLVEKEQTFLESLLNSTGITEHRRTPFGDAMKDIAKWKQAKGYTEPGEFVYDPDKDPYHRLTSTLSSGSDSAARAQLQGLLAGKSKAEGVKVYQHYQRSLRANKFLTGSKAHDREYLSEAGPAARRTYEDAKLERQKMWGKFLRAWQAEHPTAALTTTP